jgi:hypothetical protein
MTDALKRIFKSLFPRHDYKVDGESRARMLKWVLLATPFFNIFLHKFNGPDWTRDPHDHPANFISIGLKGSYVETVYDQNGEKLYDREWRAPWVRSFPATHIHRMSSVGPKGAWTLCIASNWRQNWGFMVNGRLVSWRDYVKEYRSQRTDRGER